MSLEVRIKKKLGVFLLDVEFTAEDGVFALLGASGCGKSMTLKCIAGIERPDEGRIALDGRVLFDSKKRINLPPQKRNVGYMFQDYALFPNMTVRENVMTGLLARGRHTFPGAAESILGRFHIADIAGHYPSQLSGGQKQRVAMARLIAQDPDVILLDEPFSALDSYLKWQLEQEVKQTLDGIEKPVLFVSHSRDEVYHLAGTVCCIREGRAETIAPVREFFENPRTRAACILSGCKNVTAVTVLDSHHLRVDEWGAEFVIRREIPDGVTGIGIRAHAFSETRSERSDNRIPVFEPSALEDPFEWTISFRASERGELLQWKAAKSDMPEARLPGELYLDSDAIMLLYDG